AKSARAGESCQMNRFARSAAALFLTVLVAVASTAQLHALTGLSGERLQISYLAGMATRLALAAVGPDLDYASFERAVTHALAGGEPLIGEEEVARVGQALMRRIAVRSGRQVPGMAPGSAPPTVDPAKVGLLTGLDVG